MTYAELCARLDANEHEHALGALERIRYSTLEARVSRAEATAEHERRLRYEHTLTEHDELNRLRWENTRLRSENEALRRAALSAAPVERPQAPPPAAFVPSPRRRQSPLLTPEMRRIFERDPPDPAAFDRTIEDGEAAE